MPVTEHLAASLPKRALSGLVVLHVNHWLTDVLHFNEVLIRLGVKLVFVPVLYNVPHPLPKLPYPTVIPDSMLHSKAPTFEGRMEASIDRAFDMIGAELSSTIVLEDGGYHYSSLLKRLEGHSNRRTIIPIGSVEQTLAGTRKAKAFLGSAVKRGLSYPVISIARSHLKMRYESQFVAARVVEELSLLLGTMGDFLSHRRVLVLGFGVLGRSVAHKLRSYNCNVVVIDTNPAIRRAAASEDFRTGSQVAASHAAQVTIVIGVTGLDSFGIADLTALVDGGCSTAYLASASSQDIEFSRLSLGATEEGLDSLSGQGGRRGLGGLGMSYAHGACRVVLLADGFPINFFREGSESVAERVIDPINAELLAAALWLSKERHNLESRAYLFGREGAVGINSDVEIRLMNEWLHANGFQASYDSHVLDTSPYIDIHPCEEVLAGIL
jgi:hypothetical protein